MIETTSTVQLLETDTGAVCTVNTESVQLQMVQGAMVQLMQVGTGTFGLYSDYMYSFGRLNSDYR